MPGLLTILLSPHDGFEFVFQVCDPQLNTLAHSLPSAHCSQSRLVCTMSGTALNENNQPMMLPNGEIKKKKMILVDKSSSSLKCQAPQWNYDDRFCHSYVLY